MFTFASDIPGGAPVPGPIFGFGSDVPGAPVVPAWVPAVLGTVCAWLVALCLGCLFAGMLALPVWGSWCRHGFPSACRRFMVSRADVGGDAGDAVGCAGFAFGMLVLAAERGFDLAGADAG